ncbi:MAG: hypothetical protein AAGB46_02615 [Verrucomicrobiota bacterium]
MSEEEVGFSFIRTPKRLARLVALVPVNERGPASFKMQGLRQKLGMDATDQDMSSQIF